MAKMVERDLFRRPTFNVVKAQKKAMQDSIKKSGLSREQVVDLMNDLAGLFGISLSSGNDKKLTRVTLDKWLNITETDRQIPMRALPVFCAATNCNYALDILAQAIGCQVIDGKQRKLLEWAELYHRVERDKNKMKQLEGEF